MLISQMFVLTRLVPNQEVVGVYSNVLDIQKALQDILKQYENETDCVGEMRLVVEDSYDMNKARFNRLRDVWILSHEDKPIQFWRIRPKYIS